MREGSPLPNRHDIIHPPRDEEEKWTETIRLVKSITDLAGAAYFDRGSETDQNRGAVFKETRWEDPLTDETIYLRQWTSWATIYHGLPRKRYELMIFRGMNGPVERPIPDLAYRFFEVNGALEIRDESSYLDAVQYCRKHGQQKLTHQDQVYDYLMRGRDALGITKRWSKENKMYIDDNREFEEIVLANAVASHSEEVQELKEIDEDVRAERMGKIIDAILKEPVISIEERQIHPSSWRLDQGAVLVEILRQAA